MCFMADLFLATFVHVSYLLVFCIFLSFPWLFY